MSMTINLVEDHNIYLCEGGPVYNGGTPPTPITYLTQWKIVGNSEVHTLPYPDGVVLPTGYKRCEYLEAHGTEYIELPIGFDNTDEVEMTVSFTQTNLSDKYAVAPKTWNNNTNRFGMGMHIVSGGIGDALCVAYGSTGGIYFQNPIVAQDTNIHLYTYSNYLFKLDNSNTRNVSSLIFGGTTDNLRLFYGYNSPTKCRIYTYHQVKANNTEINLIPCLDDNNMPCLYDTVSGTSFYNDGTGTFGYEIEPQPTEIWSCGEYNATDGKYHILVKPQGGSIADIALDEPLRKVNNIVDTIEFPSNTEGKALVTRNLMYDTLDGKTWEVAGSRRVILCGYWSNIIKAIANNNTIPNLLAEGLATTYYNNIYLNAVEGISQYGGSTKSLGIYVQGCIPESGNTPTQTFYDVISGKHVLIELATPTTELVDAPQIAEAESYTCVISQGGKAVSWSSFETNSE